TFQGDHGGVLSFGKRNSRTAPAGRKNGRPRPDDPKKKTVDRARQPKKLSRAARQGLETQAGASWHKKQRARKYDPSRERLPGACDKRARGRDDPDGLPPIADDGGWQHGARFGGPDGGRRRCALPL